MSVWHGPPSRQNVPGDRLPWDLDIVGMRIKGACELSERSAEVHLEDGSLVRFAACSTCYMSGGKPFIQIEYEPVVVAGGPLDVASHEGAVELRAEPFERVHCEDCWYGARRDFVMMEVTCTRFPVPVQKRWGESCGEGIARTVKQSVRNAL